MRAGDAAPGGVGVGDLGLGRRFVDRDGGDLGAQGGQQVGGQAHGTFAREGFEHCAGGLGVALIESVMDEWGLCSRADGRGNRLVMRKRVEARNEPGDDNE